MKKDSWKSKYGEWALVTGASAGIGEEFCVQLAEKGMNIISVARRKDRLDKLGEKLKSDYGINTLELSIDLFNSEAVNEIEKHGSDLGVGLLVNNAGFGHIGNFHKKNPSRDEEMIRLNCIVPVVLTHKFLPKMVERKKGGVIFLSSTSAYQATPYFTVYSATKVFNLYLGEGLWEEYRKKGIDIMALSPGYTNTEFQKSAGLTEDIKGLLWEKPNSVVNTALKNLGRKQSVIHGSVNRLFAISNRFSPRKWSTIIAGKVCRLNS